MLNNKPIEHIKGKGLPVSEHRIMKACTKYGGKAPHILNCSTRLRLMFAFHSV